MAFPYSGPSQSTAVGGGGRGRTDGIFASPQAPPDPRRQLGFAYRSRCQHQERLDAFRVGSREHPPVERQEQFADDECGALVAIGERVVSREAVGVTCSQRGGVGAFVMGG